MAAVAAAHFTTYKLPWLGLMLPQTDDVLRNEPSIIPRISRNMKTFFVLSALLGLGFGTAIPANAQLPSYCPAATEFTITPVGNAVLIAPPSVSGWVTFFPPNPAVVSGGVVTVQVISGPAGATPPSIPPVVVNGLSAGTYTMNIDASYYVNIFQPPPIIACPRVITTFNIAGIPAVSTPVPATSRFGILALIGLIAGVGFLLLARRERSHR